MKETLLRATVCSGTLVSPAAFLRRLILAALAVNLFVAATSGYALYRSWQEYEKHTRVEAENLTRALEFSLGGIFDKIDLLLKVVKDEAEQELFSGGIKERTLEAFIASQSGRVREVGNLRIDDAEGVIRYGAAPGPNAPASVADRDYFLRLRRDPGAGLFISKPLFGRISQKWIVVIARRLNHPDGSFAGDVHCSIPVDFFQRHFAGFDLGKQGVVTLRGADIGIIARFPEAKGAGVGNDKISSQFQDLLRQGRRSGTYKTPGIIDSASRIFSYRKVTGYPLYINVGRASSDYLHDWWVDAAKTLALLAVFALVSLMALLGIYRNWKRSYLAQAELGRYRDQLEGLVLERTLELERSNDQLVRKIAENIRTSEALRQSEGKYRLIVETTNEGVLTVDARHTITYLNQRLGEMLGFSERDMLGQKLDNFIHPDELQDHREKMSLRQSGLPQNYERRLVHRDGQAIWTLIAGTPIYDSHGTFSGSSGMVSDLSGTKLAALELEKSGFIMDHMSEAVCWGDAGGQLLYVNEAGCRILGYSQEELLSLCLQDLVLSMEPEDWRGKWSELSRGGVVRVERELHAKESFIAVDITYSCLKFNGNDYFCAIIRDTTQHKEAEVEKEMLRVQLNQSQKIESLGRLTGGIAHDFNNLLTPIMGYSELLIMAHADQPELVQQVEQILSAAKKAKNLVQQLLSFSRKQRLDMKVVEVNQVICSFYEILRRTIREDIEIKLFLTPQECAVKADSNQLEQILMNLAVNAQDAIAGKGTLIVETAAVTLDEEYVRQHSWSAPGRYLLLVISDTGSGMDHDTMNQIFEPFYTTKDDGSGTGLGLATVYGLVKQHGGSIQVYSEVGIGSSFKIYLPIACERPVQDAPAAPAQVAACFAGRSVLLVEDNDIVRKFVLDTLRARQMEVTEVAHPKLALDIAQGRAFDLLITDVIMPGMNGPELHQQLIQTQTNLKVLYMSGYTGNTIAQHGILDAGVNFIQKPFVLSELNKMLNVVLS
jgi:two-component system, cell cycle sensor histidine kinase and response regulator CckA